MATDDDQARDEPNAEATAPSPANARRNPPAGAGEEPADPEELRKTREALKKANDEAKRNRLKLDAYEKAEQDKADASLGESEKLRKAAQKEADRAAEAERRAEAAEREADELRLERQVVREATRLGFKYPDAAFKLVDRSRIAWDEEANDWTGIAAAIERVGASYPDLLASKPKHPGSIPRDFPSNAPPPIARRAPSGGNPREPENVNPFHVLAAETRYEPM